MKREFNKKLGLVLSVLFISLLIVLISSVMSTSVENETESVIVKAKANANYYNDIDGNYYVDPMFTTPATDDTRAINKAIKHAKQKGIKEVNIPSGKYLINAEGEKLTQKFELAINGGIQLESNITLKMQDDTVLVTNTTNNSGYSLIVVDRKENVEIIGGNLIGDMNTHPADKHNYCYGITIANASENILIKDVTITEMEDDGIMIADYTEELSGGKRTKEVEINNVKIHNNGRQGLTISTGSDIKVVDSEFSNQRKHSPMSGIDIELESYDHIGVENIEIVGNTFENNGFSGVIFSDMYNNEPDAMSKNIQINDNKFIDNRIGAQISGKVDTAEMSNNYVTIDHPVEEFSTGIGSTSLETKNLTISNNTIVSEDNENYSVGITSSSPATVISNNKLTGQRIGLMIYDGAPTLIDNIIENSIESDLEEY